MEKFIAQAEGSGIVSVKCRASRVLSSVNEDFLNQKRESGVIFLEFAITFPVLFIIVGLVMFVAHSVYHTASSTTSAVALVRHAATRSNLGTLSAIELAVTTNTLTTDFQELLASSDMQSSAFAAGGYYQTMMDTVYDPGSGTYNILQAPKGVLYALAYAYNSLRLSIAADLRFPCSDAGCARCSALNPESRDVTFSAPALAHPDFKNQYVGIQCQVYPHNAFLTPLIIGVKLASGGSINESPISLTRKKDFLTLS